MIDSCPHCGVTPERFLRNGTRKRRFLRVKNGMVQSFDAELTRWKCRSCRGSFTEYPAYALPHKGITRETIERLCETYVKSGSKTPREAVGEGDIEIACPEQPPDTAVLCAIVQTSMCASAGMPPIVSKALGAGKV